MAEPHYIIKTLVIWTYLCLGEGGEIHLDPLLAHILEEDGELVPVVGHLEVYTRYQTALLVSLQQTPEAVHYVPPFCHIHSRQIWSADVYQTGESFHLAVPGGLLVPLHKVGV